ncbi:lysophospholipid acyltransferase family protein [Solitalea koreensis]|uniref:1-acyl-sn-glycerol-3-phosphate acyltransferase n=1 Tax=Solitalea koreensis TaxID=543615 RepID=A0A521C5R3_9SPHI|nr:lysophospholipid acyltransferase family protein [Solitalea koreensis]SMO54769.1 1-acyl-sn-glycerol-3-phosphate acyltransferase [Solitalea koreensis]
MKKLLAYIFTPIYFLVWAILLCLFHVIQVIALNVFGKKAHKISVDALNFFLIHTPYILGSSVRMHFSEELPTNRPIIFIANHGHTLDIPGIIWYLRKFTPKFVSKIELGKGVPSISYNLKHSGAALIDRKDAKQAITEIARLGKLIEENNYSAVIFPEGTRSRDGIMKPFKPGGINVLLKKAPNALVVPIYIHDSWKLHRYGTFPLGFGEKLSWNILPAIEPKGKTPDEVIELAENSIRKEYDLLNKLK